MVAAVPIAIAIVTVVIACKSIESSSGEAATAGYRIAEDVGSKMLTQVTLGRYRRGERHGAGLRPCETLKPPLDLSKCADLTARSRLLIAAGHACTSS
jgi:hypothetical protein